MPVPSKLLLILLSLILAHSSIAQSKKDNTIHRTIATRVIDLRKEDDNTTHNLKDYSSDSLLSEILFNAVISRSLNAYTTATANVADTFSADSAAALIEIKSYDIENGDTVFLCVISQAARRFRFDEVRYGVAEEWATDSRTQHTSIEIKSIGILSYYQDDNDNYHPGTPLFWLRYADIKNILTRYEQYHPDNALALHIWADYFLSDKKPAIIK